MTCTVLGRLCQVADQSDMGSLDEGKHGRGIVGGTLIRFHYLLGAGEQGEKQLGRRKLNNTVRNRLAGWLLGRYPCHGNQLRTLDGCRDAKADGWTVVSRVE